MPGQADKSLRARMAQGEYVYGTLLLEMRYATLPVALATAGFDFFVIDMEHGAYDVGVAAAMIAAARLCGIAPLVRPPSHAAEHFKLMLGLGAAGVMVPNVETGEQAAQSVQAVKYPPQGTRGLSASSAQVDFETMGLADMAARSNETTFVMLQIESTKGVENVDAILRTEGVDAVLVGPGDLSLEMGLPGEYGHPDFEVAVQTVFEAAQRQGVAAGIHCTDEALARKWRIAGANLLLYASDTGLLATAAREAAGMLAGLRGGAG